MKQLELNMPRIRYDNIIIPTVKNEFIKTFRELFMLIRIGKIIRYRLFFIWYLFFFVSKSFRKIIWPFNLLTLGVPYEGYSRHTSDVLYNISTFPLRPSFISDLQYIMIRVTMVIIMSSNIYSTLIWGAMWLFVFDIAGLVDNHGPNLLDITQYHEQHKGIAKVTNTFWSFIRW